jgi:hypothetical protein
MFQSSCLKFKPIKFLLFYFLIKLLIASYTAQISKKKSTK